MIDEASRPGPSLHVEYRRAGEHEQGYAPTGDHSHLFGSGDSESKKAALRIGPGNDDRHTFRNARGVGGNATDARNGRTRLLDGNSAYRVEVELLIQLRTPFTGADIEHPRLGRQGPFAHKLARQLVPHPVRQGCHPVNSLVDGRPMLHEPSQLGRREQERGQPARHLEDPLSQRLVDGPALEYRADVGIRSGVEDATIPIEEDDALPLARHRDRRDPVRVHLGVADALGNEPRSRGPHFVRVHLPRIGRRHAGFDIAPRRRSFRNGPAVRVEQAAANTSRTRVHDDDVPVAHCLPQTSGLTRFTGLSPSMNRRMSSAIILE